MGMLKVSAQSNAIRAAGALANTIRQAGEAEIQAIGPKAVNQTVKAIAIARSYLASSGIDLVAIPSFVDVEIEGEPRTAVRFYVTPRHRLIEAAKAAPAQAPEAPTPTQVSAPAPAGPTEPEPEPEPESERTSSPPPEVLAGTMGASPPPAPTPAPETELDSGEEPRPFSGDAPAPASASESESEEERLRREEGGAL